MVDGQRLYDEEQQLTDYIWHNYSHLMKEDEWLAGRAVDAEEKAAASSGKVAARLVEALGVESDPRIEPLLRDGVSAFRTRVRNRLLKDHSGEVVIKRCPACGQVVATPRAQQCLWCGHDWH